MMRAALRATWLNQPFLRDVHLRQQVVLFGPAAMRAAASPILNTRLDEEDTETFTPTIVLRKTGA